MAARRAQLEGLPTLIIGAHRVTGSAHDSAELGAPIELAARS